MGDTTKPIRKQIPVQFGSPLVEIQTPTKLGGGLFASQNVLYRRLGSWRTRPANQTAYQASVAGAYPGDFPAPSGVRWYRSLPSILTQTVVAAAGSLYEGGDPNLTSPTALTKLVDFTAPGAVCFASAFDPAYNLGAGGDVLIMAGTTSNNGFADYPISIGTVYAAGDVITITWAGTGSGSVTYTVLSTDNAASIVYGLINAINQSAAVLPGAPFLAQAIAVPGTPNKLLNYALASGSGGNAITVKISSTNVGFNGTPAAASNFVGGGFSWKGPLKYDGTNVTGLSGAISQPFTGCVSWHNHVWYWGDPAHPGTLYASDINQPEGWSFMTANGGYPIGQGDGDPIIQDVVPIGNILYVFKTNSIYAVTGYDFQPGEYQFNIQPAIKGAGASNRGAVSVLRNALVFWTGSLFKRLSVGAFDTELIGSPIPLTQAYLAVNGSNAPVFATGGNFLTNTLLSGTLVAPQSEMLSNVAFFSIYIASLAQTLILVYDDDATTAIGNYCWSKWLGPTTLGWIPFTGGKNVANGANDLPLLFSIVLDAATASIPFLGQIGANPGAPGTTMIATTGWVTCETPLLSKELHQIFLELSFGAISTSALNQPVITCTITPSLYNTNASTGPSNYAPVTVTLPAPTLYANGVEKYQLLKVTLEPFLRANAFMFTFTVTVPNSAGQVELSSMVLDYLEEAALP